MRICNSIAEPEPIATPATTSTTFTIPAATLPTATLTTSGRRSLRRYVPLRIRRRL